MSHHIPHTPGPWNLRKRHDGLICVTPDNGLSVADCCDLVDAQLISAAPELLNALRFIYAYLEAEGNTNDYVRQRLQYALDRAAGVQA